MIRYFYEGTIWRRPDGLYGAITTTCTASISTDHWSTPVTKLEASTVDEARRELGQIVGVLNPDVKPEHCTLIIL